MKKIIHNEWFWVFIILLITFFSYFRIVYFDFVYWDDDKQIFNNIRVTKLTWEHIKHNVEYERFTFIPLILYSALYQLVGKNSFYYHLLSIFFHLINIFFFYLIIKKFSFKNFVNVFLVVLFALHPLRIESVAWISEWKDLLFTMFSLAGIAFYLKWNEKNKLVYIILYSLMFVLSAFSKIQGLILPFCILLIDVFIQRKIRIFFLLFNLLLFIFTLFVFNYNNVRFIPLIILISYWLYKKYSTYVDSILIQFRKTVLWSSLFIGFGVLTILFFTRNLSLWHEDSKFSFIDRVLFSSYSITFYIKQFFLPVQQLAIHPYPSIHGTELWIKWWPYLFSWFIVVALIFYLYRKKFFFELFGILFFILNIAIVLHFIPIEGRLIVAERYSYFAYTGLMIFTGSIVYRLIKQWKYLHFVLLFMVTILFSILIYLRSSVWQNTETLFYSVLRKKPQTTFAWQNLGSYYLENKEYTKALKCYNIAIKLNSHDNQLYLNRSLVYAALGKIYLAIIDLKKALALSNHPEEKSMILVTLGQLEAESGNPQQALSYYNASLKEYQKNFKAYLQKAMLFSSFQNFLNIDSAVFYAKEAIQINPYYADAYNTLSWLYLQKNNLSEAKKHALKSIEANSHYALSYNTLGYIYQIEGRLDSALSNYQLAIQIDSTIPEIRRNRAWIYFQTLQFSKAIKDYNYVLSKKTNDLIALTNRAFCLIKQKQYHMAITDFKKIATWLPDSADSYYNIAWAYQQAQQNDSALTYLHKTLSKNPNHIKALFDIALLYFNKTEYQQALSYFTTLQKILPNNGEVLFWIGKTYLADKKNIIACNYFKMSYEKGFMYAKNFFFACN